ncbi:hypothetical protein [Arvimicrobium flavum]|uniref:hypothetical protein n=1 Tax=Arvimicrobium flavum TaxID=3393320 RepID=UPI00237BB61B|nr:hypothetical protein [Mesorhizobium shangrilense]
MPEPHPCRHATGGSPAPSWTLVFVFLAYLPVVLLTTFIPSLSPALPRMLLVMP